MDPEVIAGLGAVVMGVASCLTAWAAVIKARKETKSAAERDCQERLRRARTQAEDLAEELHNLRMTRYNAHPPDWRPEEVTSDTDIEERWSHLP
jgi:hypothetical protein